LGAKCLQGPLWMSPPRNQVLMKTQWGVFKKDFCSPEWVTCVAFCGQRREILCNNKDRTAWVALIKIALPRPHCVRLAAAEGAFAWAYIIFNMRAYANGILSRRERNHALLGAPRAEREKGGRRRLTWLPVTTRPVSADALSMHKHRTRWINDAPKHSWCALRLSARVHLPRAQISDVWLTGGWQIMHTFRQTYALINTLWFSFTNPIFSWREIFWFANK